MKFIAETIWARVKNSETSQELLTLFSRLNAGSVYLKLSPVDPAPFRTRRLFGARRLFIKCIFWPFILYRQYWRFIEFINKNIKNCETVSTNLSYLSEDGKSFSKRRH